MLCFDLNIWTRHVSLPIGVMGDLYLTSTMCPVLITVIWYLCFGARTSSLLNKQTAIYWLLTSSWLAVVDYSKICHRCSELLLDASMSEWFISNADAIDLHASTLKSHECHKSPPVHISPSMSIHIALPRASCLSSSLFILTFQI